MRKMTKAVLWSALMLAPVAAHAQGQPPIQSPQDAACRQEAANRVFSAPNPTGQSLYSIGRQIWFECMSRAGRSYKRVRHVRVRHVRRAPHKRVRHVQRAHRHAKRVRRAR